MPTSYLIISEVSILPSISLRFFCCCCSAYCLASFVKEEVNLDSPEIKQEKYDNLINQIYNLQMKQFAESICGIKKENNQNNYIIIFDPTENIQSIKLSEKEYLDFIHFRDPLNSISIYDLFQEKTHLYYNTGSNNKINLKSNFKKEDFQVAKKIQIKYYIYRFIYF